MRLAQHQFALLELVEHDDQIGRLQPQAGTQLARGDTGIVRNDRQHRKVHRPQPVHRHALQKQPDHRQRSAAGVVADQGFQVAGIDLIDRSHLGLGGRSRVGLCGVVGCGSGRWVGGSWRHDGCGGSALDLR
jgi:hypothetical protein